jgi:hypothetical protein
MFSVRFNARLDTSHHGPTAASVQRCRGGCGWSDRHPQCDGEVPLRCQQELHTQGVLGVSTGKNPEGSNLESVEAMQWVLLYLSIGHYIGNISHSAAKMCRSTILHVPHSFSYNSQIKCFRTHVDMDIFLVLVCGNRTQSLSTTFSYTHTHIYIYFFIYKIGASLYVYHLCYVVLKS